MRLSPSPLSPTSSLPSSSLLLPSLPLPLSRSHFLSPPLHPSMKLHKQQSGGELSRHTWHRQDSDDSSDSVTEEGGSGGGNPNPRNPIPRSHTFPISTSISTPGPIPSSNSGPNPDRGTTPGQDVTPLQSNSQRRYGGNTGNHDSHEK